MAIAFALVVGAVRVGVEGHRRAEGLAHQGDQPLGAARQGVGVFAHPAAEAVLERLGAGLGDELLQVLPTSASGVLPRVPLAR